MPRHFPSLAKLLSSLALSSSALFVSNSALASDVFPGAVRDNLEMPCLPSCLLCHTVNPGISLTAKQPFAGSMITAANRPLPSQGEVEWVQAGLAGLGTTDTDEDGMSDLDELKAGRDPNVKGAGDICAPDVHYGCGAASVAEPASGSLGGAAWFVLGGLAVAAAARARRTRA